MKTDIQNYKPAQHCTVEVNIKFKEVFQEVYIVEIVDNYSVTK